MKEITTSKGAFIFVEVPDDADGFDLCNDNELAISIPNPDPDYLNWITKYIELPNGNYRFICTTKNATEEQAEMFGICAITKDGTMYKYGVVAKDGLPAAQGEKGWCWSDFEISLQSAINKFLKQNKLARKNNYAIIQKL